MHNTIIILKEPKREGNLVKLVFSSPIERAKLDPNKFEHSYIKLVGYNPIYIFQMLAAVTQEERISKTLEGDVDEIAAMRKTYDEYKTGRVILTEDFFVEPELRYSKK